MRQFCECRLLHAIQVTDYHVPEALVVLVKKPWVTLRKYLRKTANTREMVDFVQGSSRKLVTAEGLLSVARSVCREAVAPATAVPAWLTAPQVTGANNNTYWWQKQPIRATRFVSDPAARKRQRAESPSGNDDGELGPDGQPERRKGPLGEAWSDWNENTGFTQ